jgi:hypothetical protein
MNQTFVYNVGDQGQLLSSPTSPTATDTYANENIGVGIDTDCCGEDRRRNRRSRSARRRLFSVAGNATPHDYDSDVEGGPENARVWCFGCQWGARGHQPVDNEKIRELVQCFMSLILGGSTTLENIAQIVSHTYRVTIRDPARALGQRLPDWPPAVVKRHIENMTEPRVVNALLIRRQLALLTQLYQHTMEIDPRTQQQKPNIQVVRTLLAGQKELREMYRQVPKDSFGYNENLMADSWSAGSVLVHPARIQRNTGGSAAAAATGVDENQQQRQQRDYAGAPVAASAGQAGVRQSAVSLGGEDTGELRGPSNNEELLRRV